MVILMLQTQTPLLLQLPKLQVHQEILEEQKKYPFPRIMQFSTAPHLSPNG
jgi:hypothetical protein